MPRPGYGSAHRMAVRLRGYFAAAMIANLAGEFVASVGPGAALGASPLNNDAKLLGIFGGLEALVFGSPEHSWRIASGSKRRFVTLIIPHNCLFVSKASFSRT